MRRIICALIGMFTLLCMHPVQAAEFILLDDFKGTHVRFPDGTKKLYPDRQKWAFTFIAGIKWPDSYGDGTNWLGVSNFEGQTYVTPFLTHIKGKPIPTNLRYDPFEIKEDGLHIRAKLLSKEQQAAYQVGSFRRFGSGIIISRKSFTFGKIRMVAKLPNARGSWPAFWLLPASNTWPPELDIFEAMVWGPHSTEYHTGYGPAKVDGKGEGKWIDVGVDLSKDFHEYGMNWEPDKITWLFDGKEIWSKPTTQSLKQDMYLLINLAVGGKWAINELGVKPIDDTSDERLNRGTDLFENDYASEAPAEMIIKSVSVEKF